MSVPLPVIAAAASGIQLLEQSVVTLVVGEIIEQASGGAAQLSKAQNILEVAQGLMAINSGTSTGLANLQTAFLSLIKTVSDPAIQLVFNGLFAALLTKIQAYEAAGSLLGQVGSIVANDFLSYVAAAAQTYVNKLTPAS